MSSEKILIYLGANRGKALFSMNKNFDKVYAFEADPELYEDLRKKIEKNEKFSNITLINAAICYEDGTQEFYINHKRGTSSLYEIDEESYEFYNIPQELPRLLRKVMVKKVSLKNFLKENKIEKIQHYQSDIQGHDYVVLESIKDFINERRIETLFIETYGNKSKSAYKNAINSFENFNKILKENYELVGGNKGLSGRRRESDLSWRLKK